METILASQYASQLDFFHLSTFSFQRGQAQLDLINDIKKQIFDLQQHPQTAPGIRQRDQKLASLETFLNHTQLLFNSDGVMHPTAEKMATLQYNSPEAKQLLELLIHQTPVDAVQLCAPVYRDALVFYDQEGGIVSVLNVCLACSFMQNETGTFIKAGNATYAKLANFLETLGHEIAMK